MNDSTNARIKRATRANRAGEGAGANVGAADTPRTNRTGVGAGAADTAQHTKPSTPSKLNLFLRATLFDFMLVLVVSTCLTIAVSFGFESAPNLRTNVLLVTGITAPMCVLLFAGSYSKRAIPVSVVLCIAYGIALLAVLQSMAPSDVPLFVDNAVNDTGDNYFVFGLVVAIVPVLVYLLSRRRAGVFVLFVCGALACQLTQFMFRDWADTEPALAISLIAYVCMAAMFVFQSYRSSIYQARRLKQTHFAGVSAYAMLIAGICLGAGALVFFVIIAPAGLSTPGIKPFQEYFERPTIEYSGIYTEQEVENPDIVTNKTNDEVQKTNQDAKGGVDNQSPQDDNSQGANPISTTLQQFSNFDLNDWQEMFDTINYNQLALNAALLLIPLIALFVLVVWLFHRRRAKRLEKIANEDPAYRVWFLWAFLEERLRRLGIEKPDTLTPMEYALASRNVMLPFNRGTGGVDYLQLTLIYQRAVYAGANVSEDDYKKFESFYNAFFANAKRVSGKIKWLWRFWRI